MRVLVIENFVGTPPGQVGHALAHAGIETEVRQAFQGDVVPDTPDGYAGLVVLGGAQSARDDADHPYLPRIAALARQFGDRDKPVLGICLGAQLLAGLWRREHPRPAGRVRLAGGSSDRGWQG